MLTNKTGINFNLFVTDLPQIQQIEENNLSFTTWLNFLEYLDGSDSSFDFELLKAMNEG